MKSVHLTQADLSAIVLAGGLSSRMGQDKALLPIANVPLLRRTCETALDCAAQVFVVTPWVDRYQPILPSSCHLVAEQPLPGGSLPHGPLIGFAQGLAQIPTDWVLLLACDLPRLNSVTLQAWATQVNPTESTIAWLPQSDKGWEPLCGFYRASCLSSLTAAIERGERSFQRWLVTQPVQALAIADSSLLLNCNTPADLLLIERQGSEIE
jgi:molybdopterin-guanine dinucleotide biosynthesis protein A